MTSTVLPAFEGKAVLKMAARVTGAGDGLSDPLAVDGQPHHHGDEVFVVLRCEVSQINHKPLQKDDADHLVRVETYSAIEGTLVDEDDVSHLLEAAATKVREAKANAEDEQRRAEEQEAGILRLDDAVEPTEAELLELEEAAAERERAEAAADVEAADELERARGRRAAGAKGGD